MTEGEAPKLTGPAEKVLRRRELPGLLLEEKAYFSNIEAPSHDHPDAVFCIVLQGGCTEVYGCKTREYRPFDSEFLPPGHQHSLRFHAPRTRCLSLQIERSWLERVQEYGLRLGDSVHSQGGVLMELFAKVHRELQAGDAASCLALQGLTAEMLAHVSRFAAPGTPRRPRWLEQVRELLHARFTDQLRLCAMADEVGVHPTYLAREFRRHFGRTMGQYVRELRIRQSMAELSRPQANIADIAVAAGFADHAHFSRSFKAQTGMTPGEYRRTLVAETGIRDFAEPCPLRGAGEMDAD